MIPLRPQAQSPRKLVVHLSNIFQQIGPHVQSFAAADGAVDFLVTVRIVSSIAVAVEHIGLE